MQRGGLAIKKLFSAASKVLVRLEIINFYQSMKSQDFLTIVGMKSLIN